MKNGFDKRFLREQRKLNHELKEMMKEQQRLMNEEQKLKVVAFALLKDHKIRLDFHWKEILHRTTK